MATWVRSKRCSAQSYSTKPITDLFIQAHTKKGWIWENSRNIWLTECSPWMWSNPPGRNGHHRLCLSIRKTATTILRQLSEIERSCKPGFVPETAHWRIYWRARRSYDIFNFETETADIGKSKLPKTIETRQGLRLTMIFSALHECLLDWKTPQGRFEQQWRYFVKSQGAVCPLLFKRYRNILVNVRPTYRPCLTSSDGIIRRQRDNEPGKARFSQSKLII